MLGLGRALGETMAVTMVIGNRPEISASLFAPGYTLASVIANEFTEATSDLYLNALFELGLVLLAITILVNVVAQLMLRTLTGRRHGQGVTERHDRIAALPARARPADALAPGQEPRCDRAHGR